MNSPECRRCRYIVVPCRTALVGEKMWRSHRPSVLVKPKIHQNQIYMPVIVIITRLHQAVGFTILWYAYCKHIARFYSTYIRHFSRKKTFSKICWTSTPIDKSSASHNTPHGHYNIHPILPINLYPSHSPTWPFWWWLDLLCLMISIFVADEDRIGLRGTVGEEY
jgi:hypothetical protein